MIMMSILWFFFLKERKNFCGEHKGSLTRLSLFPKDKKMFCNFFLFFLGSEKWFWEDGKSSAEVLIFLIPKNLLGIYFDFFCDSGFFYLMTYSIESFGALL